jgi:hypothetical protein
MKADILFVVATANGFLLIGIYIWRKKVTKRARYYRRPNVRTFGCIHASELCTAGTRTVQKLSITLSAPFLGHYTSNAVSFDNILKDYRAMRV